MPCLRSALFSLLAIGCRGLDVKVRTTRKVDCDPLSEAARFCYDTCIANGTYDEKFHILVDMPKDQLRDIARCTLPAAIKQGYVDKVASLTVKLFTGRDWNDDVLDNVAKYTFPAAIEEDSFDAIVPNVKNENKFVRFVIARFTLPAAIDKGLFHRVAGLVTDLSKDENGDVRHNIAWKTLPAAINQGHFDEIAPLVTALSKDEDGGVRARIADETLPAAINHGHFDEIAPLVTALSKVKGFGGHEVRQRIAQFTLPAAIDKGYFDEVATLVTELSKDKEQSVRTNIAKYAFMAAIQRGRSDWVASILAELSKQSAKIEVNDTVEVLETVTVITISRSIVLEPGQKGTVKEINDWGNALVNWVGRGEAWLLQKYFPKVRTVKEWDNPGMREFMAKLTFPAVIQEGHADKATTLVTQLSGDQKAAVRENIAEFTIPAAINQGQFDWAVPFVTKLSMDPDYYVLEHVRDAVDSILNKSRPRTASDISRWEHWLLTLAGFLKSPSFLEISGKYIETDLLTEDSNFDLGQSLAVIKAGRDEVVQWLAIASLWPMPPGSSRADAILDEIHNAPAFLQNLTGMLDKDCLMQLSFRGLADACRLGQRSAVSALAIWENRTALLENEMRILLEKWDIPAAKDKLVELETWHLPEDKIKILRTNIIMFENQEFYWNVILVASAIICAVVVFAGAMMLHKRVQYTAAKSGLAGAEGVAALDKALATAYECNLPREMLVSAEQRLAEARTDDTLYRDAEKAIEAATAFQVEEELPSRVCTPSSLPVFKLYLHVYSNPKFLHRKGLLKPTIENGLRITCSIISEGKKGWTFPALEDVQDRAALNCTLGYQVARGCVDAHEESGLARLVAKMVELSGMKQEYHSNLETLDPVERLYQMYVQCFHVKEHLFDPMMDKIAKASKCEKSSGDPKGILRLCEKTVLRPTSGLVWDPVRMMFVGEMDKLVDAIDSLIAQVDNGSIIIVGANDRFSTPTKDGWQDAAVYIMYTEVGSDGIVCEIQLVHPRFLDIRTRFGAHDSYDESRFIAELRKVFGEGHQRGLPHSQRNETNKEWKALSLKSEPAAATISQDDNTDNGAAPVHQGGEIEMQTMTR